MSAKELKQRLKQELKAFQDIYSDIESKLASDEENFAYDIGKLAKELPRIKSKIREVQQELTKALKRELNDSK